MIKKFITIGPLQLSEIPKVAEELEKQGWAYVDSISVGAMQSNVVSITNSKPSVIPVYGLLASKFFESDINPVPKPQL